MNQLIVAVQLNIINECVFVLVTSHGIFLVENYTFAGFSFLSYVIIITFNTFFYKNLKSIKFSSLEKVFNCIYNGPEYFLLTSHNNSLNLTVGRQTEVY